MEDLVFLVRLGDSPDLVLDPPGDSWVDSLDDLVTRLGDLLDLVSLGEGGGDFSVGELRFLLFRGVLPGVPIDLERSTRVEGSDGFEGVLNSI